MELSSAYSGGTSRTLLNQNSSVQTVHEGVVELKSADGTALVRVGSSLFPVKDGAALSTGDKVMLAFSRNPDGTITIEIAPKQDGVQLSNSAAVMTKGEYVAINALSMLLGNLETKVTSPAVQKEIEALKSLIRALVKNSPSSLSGTYTEPLKLPISNNDKQIQTPTPTQTPLVQTETLSNAVQTQTKTLPDLRAIVEKLVSNPEIPEKTRELLKVAVNQIDKKFLPVSVPQEGPLPVKVIPGVKLSVEVTDVRVDGRVSVAQRGGEPFQIQLPISVRQGDKLTFLPVTERAWSLEELVPFAAGRKSEPHSQIRQIVERVLAEPQFTAYKNNVSAPELSHIEKAVESTVRAWNLPPDDADAMVRTLFKLSENHNVRDRIKVENASFAGIKNTGETFTKIILALSDAIANPAVNEKDKESLRPLLEQLKSFVAPVLTDATAPEKGVAVLRKLEERSGLFFEHKLMRLLSAPQSERGQILAGLKDDLKGQLTAILENIAKAEMISSVKEQITGETGKLLSQIDSLQVRNSADQDWRHVYIPVVQDGEPRSAQVSFRRRGRKGSVDPENSSVVLRVAPSCIGDMEAAAKITDNKLFVKFSLQTEALVDAFNRDKQLLNERLSGLGYSVAGLEAGLWNLKMAKETHEPVKRDVPGFDITI